MSFYEKIRGTIETIFQIGLGGPQLKANGGTIEARNATDTAFAIERVANAVAPNDAVNLGQLPATVPGPWASVLYVDNVRGNDVTAVRGNQNLPFATIQAALNAMLTDDTVQLAPQKFTQAQLTVPATVGRGACVGYKQPGLLNTAAWPGTEIRSTGANSWEFGATLGITRWLLADIMHQAGIISADGSVAPYAKDTFFVSGLWIRDCTGFVTGKYATQIVVEGPHGNGNYIFTGCDRVEMHNVEGPGGNFTVTWDAADPLTTTGNTGLVVSVGCQLGNIVMAKQAHVSIDELARIAALNGSGGLNAVGASVPQIVCCGHVGGVVDFATAGSELPDTATVMTLDLRGTRFYYTGVPGINNVIGPGTIKFKVAGVAPANFQTGRLDSSVTLPATTITADNKIHITGRGARWPAVILTTPGTDGDINPPLLTGTVDLSAGGAVAKSWVQLGYAGLIRTGVAPDAAFVTSIAQAADAVVQSTSTLGMTFASTVAAGNTAASWEAVWK